MKLTVEEMIPEFQRIARSMDMGDITSEPRETWVSLKRDDIIDLMIDAYHLGHRHGREKDFEQD
jgi:hypothetical protein